MRDPLCLRNDLVAVQIDWQSGLLSISDAQSNEALLTDARLGPLPTGSPRTFEPLGEQAVDDAIGTGWRVVVAVSDFGLFRHSDHHASRNTPPQRLVSLTLYDDCPALVIGFGLKTLSHYSMRLMGGHGAQRRQAV
jgi:hypothetical protein